MKLLSHFRRFPESLKRIFENKNVVITGPSSHIVGLKQGKNIDSFDLVVRMNHQWPIPRGRVLDLGKRIDVLFHCCNGDYPLNPLFNKTFESLKCVFFEAGPTSATLQKYCKAKSVPAFEITEMYLEIGKGCGGHPNTGTVAISLLSKLPVKKLFVTGISCFRAKYYRNYAGVGANPRYWKKGIPKNIWRHRFQSQIEFLSGLYEKYPKFEADPFLTSIFSTFREKQNESRDLAGGAKSPIK